MKIFRTVSGGSREWSEDATLALAVFSPHIPFSQASRLFVQCTFTTTPSRTRPSKPENGVQLFRAKFQPVLKKLNLICNSSWASKNSKITPFQTKTKEALHGNGKQTRYKETHKETDKGTHMYKGWYSLRGRRTKGREGGVECEYEAQSLGSRSLEGNA